MCTIAAAHAVLRQEVNPKRRKKPNTQGRTACERYGLNQRQTERKEKRSCADSQRERRHRKIRRADPTQSGERTRGASRNTQRKTHRGASRNTQRKTHPHRPRREREINHICLAVVGSFLFLLLPPLEREESPYQLSPSPCSDAVDGPRASPRLGCVKKTQKPTHTHTHSLTLTLTHTLTHKRHFSLNSCIRTRAGNVSA